MTKKRVTICLRDYKISIMNDDGEVGSVKAETLEKFIEAKSAIEQSPELYDITYTR